MYKLVDTNFAWSNMWTHVTVYNNIQHCLNDVQRMLCIPAMLISTTFSCLLTTFYFLMSIQFADVSNCQTCGHYFSLVQHVNTPNSVNWICRLAMLIFTTFYLSLNNFLHPNCHKSYFRMLQLVTTSNIVNLICKCIATKAIASCYVINLSNLQMYCKKGYS